MPTDETFAFILESLVNGMKAEMNEAKEIIESLCDELESLDLGHPALKERMRTKIEYARKFVERGQE